jgi:hypothetical protein
MKQARLFPQPPVRVRDLVRAALMGLEFDRSAVMLTNEGEQSVIPAGAACGAPQCGQVTGAPVSGGWKTIADRSNPGFLGSLPGPPQRAEDILDVFMAFRERSGRQAYRA